MIIGKTAILLLVSGESAGYRPAVYVVQPSGFGQGMMFGEDVGILGKKNIRKE